VVPATLNAVGTAFLPAATIEFAPTSNPAAVAVLPMIYVSPTLIQFNYTGGAVPGTYYARVKNSDGTLSQPIVVTVEP